MEQGVREWLYEQFGENGTEYWCNYDRTIYFKTEEDYTMFLLRWS